jgi:hypothetical protein
MKNLLTPLLQYFPNILMNTESHNSPKDPCDQVQSVLPQSEPDTRGDSHPLKVVENPVRAQLVGVDNMEQLNLNSNFVLVLEGE